MFQAGSERNVPTVFLVVDGLPKDALVEKQVLFHTGRCLVTDEDGDVSLEPQAPVMEEGKSDIC